MIKGLYAAAAGMLSTLTTTDTLASNLANVSTVGFKGSRNNFQSFPDMLIDRLSVLGQSRVGSVSTGSQIRQSFVNFAQGPLRQTGNTFDVAIQGDGFFTVKSPISGQTYYTRAGNFTVNQDGFLSTMNGDLVQGKLGNIQLNLDSAPFSISREGTISGKGRTIDQLLVTQFSNNQSLSKISDNLYQATAYSKELPQPVDPTQSGYSVLQGTLEDANVNPVAELVNNIEGMRLYEALQKNIQMQNEALTKTVNTVGSLK